MSLTSCMKKAGDALALEDRSAILLRAQALRGEGLKADAAGRQAVQEQLAIVAKSLAQAEEANALELAAPSREDLQAADDRAAAVEKADKAEQARLKRQADKDRERKELGDQVRQDASADGFVLGQTPQEVVAAMAGNGDLFGEPAPTLRARVDAMKTGGRAGTDSAADEAAVQSVGELLGPADAGVEPEPDQVGADGFIARSESAADGDAGQAGGMQADGGGDVELLRRVYGLMRGIAQDDQVLKAVVDLVPVDMVDVLRREELSPEALFNDPAVLEDLAGFTGDAPIPLGIDAALAVVKAAAAFAAEAPRTTELARGAADLQAAVDTLESRQGVTPNSSAALGAVSGATDAAPSILGKAPSKIEDVGEKIGGARKDTAVGGGSARKRASEETRPAWARRFEVAQSVTGIDENGDNTGRWVIRDTRSLDWMKQPKQVGRNTYATKEEAEAFVPIAAVGLKHRPVPTRDGKYEIWREITDRKRVKVVDREFGSRDEAMAYIAANAVAIIETNTTFGEADMPLPPDRARTGPERRTGDVAGDDFKTTFGFRGVEFGNWNNQDERQALMNDAWDGLLDLADVLGVPPKALGLNGDLALAFGARGHGLQSARAHYELDRAVINLTKERGAGSLAHEWFHALDHYFGRQDGKASKKWEVQADGTRTLKARGDGADMASSGFQRNQSGVRPEVREAYDALLTTLFKKAESYVEDMVKVDKFTGLSREELAQQLDALRKDLSEQKDPRYWKRNNKPASAEQLAAFDAIATKMVDGELLETDWRVLTKGSDQAARASMSTRWTNDALEQLSAIYKEVRGRSGFTAEKSGVFDRLRGYMTRHSQRLKMLASAQEGGEKKRMVPTSFSMNAKELDQGRGTDYWTTPHEMAARAFQGYVEDKIAERGGVSRFLNYGPENVGILTPWGFKRPFPVGEERKAINGALDKFIGTLETREDADGNVALFNAGGSPATPEQKLTKQRLETLVQDALADMAQAPAVTILDSPRDIPGMKMPANVTPAGGVVGGRIYLFRDNITSEAQALRTVFHELFHFGLDRILPREQYTRAMLGLLQKDGKVREYARRWRQSEEGVQRREGGMPAQDWQALAVEEALADIAEEIGAGRVGDRLAGTLQRIAAWMADLAQQLGMRRVAEAIRGMTRTEAQAFVLQAIDAAGRPGRGEAGGARLASDRGRAGQTSTPAFRSWFGDSKAVDGGGDPKQVYHGTGGDIEAFDRGRAGQTTQASNTKLGFFFTDRVGVAGAYARIAGGAQNIVPVYLSLQNPLRLTATNMLEADRMLEQELAPEHDGAIIKVQSPMRDGGVQTVYMVRQPTQIKSSIGNRGTFDPAEADIRLRAPRTAAGQAVSDFMAASRAGTTKGFNSLHKTISTQLHKASANDDFAKVFDIAQDYERDIARAAARPAALAPDVLPAFDNVRAAFGRLLKGDKEDAKVRQVGNALFAGTLENGPEADNGVIWTDAQLRSRFQLDDDGVRMYRQARKAIEASLDETSAALAFQMVKTHAPGLKDAVRANPRRARQIIEGALAELAQVDEEIGKALQAASAVFDRAADLKAGAYAPLMRFGRFSVDVVDAGGERVHFDKFDTEMQAKVAAVKLARQFPGATVSRSTMSEEAYKLFSGVDPDTVALFADQLDGQLGDIINKEALQEWYRNAVGERSALKRMIAPRSGMAGYSPDLRRVLASFITSNARLSARQFNMGDMTAALDDQRERKVAGDVLDEGMKLKAYLDNPDEPFRGLRSLMFTWYLGGSVASAVVNLTQPLMMTLPYLSQFGSASKALAGAAKEAATGKVTDARLAAALQRAADDGKVDAQEVHHLYHEGMASAINALPAGNDLKARAQGFATLWGSFFGAAENFNRRLTFIAAFRMAEADAALGNPYEFAIRAIDETQGIYNKSNRPNWARGTGSFGAVGVAAFTFKQYSIAYVELLVRMVKSGPQGKRAALAMLGMLVLASGLQGLPGAEDLEDLIDTAAQWMGLRGNTKAALRETLVDAFGTSVADVMMYGASAALPLDFGSRLGLGNLLPATGMLKPSDEGRRASQIAEVFGPMAGFSGQILDAGAALDAGRGAGAALTMFAPLAVKNAMMGATMFDQGFYPDMAGRKVTDTSPGDAALKAIGFQPTSVSEKRKPQSMVLQDISRVKGVESDIVQLRARAKVDSDPAARERANQLLRDWNTRNPDLRIAIKESQVLRRVLEMRRTSAERILNTAPRETRRALAQEL